MKKLIVLISVLQIATCNTALAVPEYYVNYGLGVEPQYTFPNSTIKMISLGETDHLWKVFEYKLDFGAYIDNSQTQGLIGFASPQIGLRTKGEGFYVGYFVGPALITQTDTRLDDLFEFDNDFELGIRDNRGVRLGVDYKHLSDGGLTSNNIGRDFFLFQLTIPWR